MLTRPAFCFLALVTLPSVAHAAAEPQQKAEILSVKDGVPLLYAPDLQRTLERFEGGPYRKLLDTPKGKDFGEFLKKSFATYEKVPLTEVLPFARTFCMGLLPAKGATFDSTQFWTLTVEREAELIEKVKPALGEPAAEGDGARCWFWKNGLLYQKGGTFAFWGPGFMEARGLPADRPKDLLAALKPEFIAVKPPAGGDSCVQLNIDSAHLAFALATLPDHLKGYMQQRARGLQIEWTLTKNGLREDRKLALTDEQRKDWVQAAKPHANLDLLKQLPADTLAAFTCRFTPDFTKNWHGTIGIREEDPWFLPWRVLMQQWELPEMFEMVKGLDGDVLIFAQASETTVPSVTLQWAMAKDIADKVMSMVCRKHNMGRLAFRPDRPEIETYDKLYSGKLAKGVRLETAYKSGILYITTHLDGVKSLKNRTPGFWENPEIKKIRESVPEEAWKDMIFCGLSRSSESWANALGGFIRRINKYYPDQKVPDETLAYLEKLMKDSMGRSHVYGFATPEGTVMRTEGVLGSPSSATAVAFLMSFLIMTGPDGRTSYLDVIKAGMLFADPDPAPEHVPAYEPFEE